MFLFVCDASTTKIRVISQSATRPKCMNERPPHIRSATLHCSWHVTELYPPLPHSTDRVEYSYCAYIVCIYVRLTLTNLPRTSLAAAAARVLTAMRTRKRCTVQVGWSTVVAAGQRRRRRRRSRVELIVVAVCICVLYGIVYE